MEVKGGVGVGGGSRTERLLLAFGDIIVHGRTEAGYHRQDGGCVKETVSVNKKELHGGTYPQDIDWKGGSLYIYYSPSKSSLGKKMITAVFGKDRQAETSSHLTHSFKT